MERNYWVRTEHGRVWGIDHGLCFHPQFKLRTVIWDWTEQPIPDAWLADLERCGENLLWEGERFRWRDADFGPFPLSLDHLPEGSDFCTSILQRDEAVACSPHDERGAAHAMQVGPRIVVDEGASGVADVGVERRAGKEALDRAR